MRGWFDCECIEPLPARSAFAGRGQPGPAPSRIPCGEGAGSRCWLGGEEVSELVQAALDAAAYVVA
jgi:hypothetical protein